MTKPSATTSVAAMPRLPVLSATERTRHRRLREQGRRDRQALYEALRAGFITHPGILVDGAPLVVLTAYSFEERTVYVHGSVASRSLRPGDEQVACLTVTIVDG